MSSSRRVYQIAEKIRNTIAVEVMRLADPRFNLVTITSAVVSPDLGQAKVYWVVGDKERIQEIGEAFVSASGILRKACGDALGIRFTPALKFFYDDTLDAQEEIDKLFAKVEAQRNGEGIKEDGEK
jgi:ribosome-binding factor A